MELNFLFWISWTLVIHNGTNCFVIVAKFSEVFIYLPLYNLHLETVVMSQKHLSVTTAINDLRA